MAPVLLGLQLREGRAGPLGVGVREGVHGGGHVLLGLRDARLELGDIAPHLLALGLEVGEGLLQAALIRRRGALRGDCLLQLFDGILVRRLRGRRLVLQRRELVLDDLHLGLEALDEGGQLGDEHVVRAVLPPAQQVLVEVAGPEVDALDLLEVRQLALRDELVLGLLALRPLLLGEQLLRPVRAQPRYDPRHVALDQLGLGLHREAEVVHDGVRLRQLAQGSQIHGDHIPRGLERGHRGARAEVAHGVDAVPRGT
mmetsp:Transcript_6403/g.20603  ORF Transcript_6403/g.20603 Transcript_6403/m.20603 type:complete len:256 (-) Transcript_6403:1055-1822(-)